MISCFVGTFRKFTNKLYSSTQKDIIIELNVIQCSYLNEPVKIKTIGYIVFQLTKYNKPHSEYKFTLLKLSVKTYLWPHPVAFLIHCLLTNKVILINVALKYFAMFAMFMKFSNVQGYWWFHRTIFYLKNVYIMFS